jgi:ornithine cyclodeaminase/alanine dehydrogenase-like protein (mu-crystallin family)
MRVISGDDIARALTFPHLINALEQAFRGETEVPARHHHRIAQQDAEATLLLMPAWNQEFLGCKLVTVFPQNAAQRMPSVSGTYLLMSGLTGEPLAAMDGRALTAWRTAAASALAAKYLARPDAERLLMIGAGALAPHLVRAHASVRPIRRMSLWNRTRSRAEALAFPLVWDGYDAAVGDDLPTLVREADVVCCATLASAPLLRGEWLRPGTHVDLVGSFRPDMREADDEALRRARIFVDTRVALEETGDLVDPIRRGVIGAADIKGDLFDLCRGRVEGRTSSEEITLFKSVGTALEDFAAAILVWHRAGPLDGPESRPRSP